MFNGLVFLIWLLACQLEFPCKCPHWPVHYANIEILQLTYYGINFVVVRLLVEWYRNQ